MALNDSNKNSISFKKLVGKAHTQQTFAFNEESISSNISISCATVFGETIDPTPITNGLTIPYSNDGIVEKVKFELEVIPDTQIGTNQSQGYRIKLPTGYTGLGALGSIYSGGTILYKALGRLQIVPSLYGKLKSDGSTEYDPILYQTNGSTIITKFDSIDWILDTYAGTIFVQSPPSNYNISAARPGYLEAFLYIGKYVDQIISGTTPAVSGPNFSVQWRNGTAFSGSGFFEFIPSANTVTLGTRTSGTFGRYSLSIGSGNTVSGNNSAAIGAGNNASGLNSLAINSQTSAEGVQSFAGGFGLTSKKIISAGASAFNFSRNTSSQISGHGANADESVILGGRNNNISSLNIGSVIIGGNAIKLNSSGYTYTTAVQNLAIFGPVSGGTSGDTFLVIDNTTKKVRGRTTSEVIGNIAQAQGPFYSIQYNKNGGFSGQTEFYIDESQRALTLGSRDGSIGVNSFVIGGNSTASGNYSFAIGDNTISSNKASIGGGTNTTVSGANSIVYGESNILGGNRSIVLGYNNTDLANDSAIIGGSGNTVSSGNTGIVLLGVNDLTITGSSYSNTTLVDQFAIFGSLTTGTTGDTVLVIDSTTKKIKTVSQSSIAITGITTVTANNGLTKVGNNIYLGGQLTGSTTIGLTDNNLIFTATTGTLRYGGDYSGNYNIRSLVDKGYVTGITTTLTTTANNGITKSGQNFRLGGTLTGNTIIDGNNKNLYFRFLNTGGTFNVSGSTGYNLSFDPINKRFIAGNDCVVTGGSINFTFGDTNTNDGVFGSAMFGELSYIDPNVGSALAVGEAVWIRAYGGKAFGRGSRVNSSGNFSLVGGGYTVGSTNPKTNDKVPQTNGFGSFGFYNTDGGQTDNHGALADYSAILGGLNHNIPSSSIRSAILGGDAIKVNTGVTNTVHFPKVRFGLGNNANITTNNTNNNLLVRNSTTGEIEIRDASTISGGTGNQNIYSTKTIVSGNTTLTNSDFVIFCQSSVTSITLTLPIAPVDGQVYKIKDVDNALVNNITIDGNGKNIDGSSTALINTQKGGIEIVFDQTLDGWYVLNFVG